MPIGYVVVSADGRPPPVYRSRNGDRRYETKSLPWKTATLEGGFPYVKSRARAVSWADESSSVLLTLEGESDFDEGSHIAECRQLTVLEATPCFCHPAQLEHQQAVVLAASMARLASLYSDDSPPLAAIEAAERHALASLVSTRLLAGQAAEAITRWLSEERVRRGVSGPGAAWSAAEAARATAATATAVTRAAERWQIEAWQATSSGWLRRGEEQWMVPQWASTAARRAEMAVVEAFRVAHGARPCAAVPGQRDVEEMVWEQYLSWGDMLFGGMSAREFIAVRETDAKLLRILEGTHEGVQERLTRLLTERRTTQRDDEGRSSHGALNNSTTEYGYMGTRDAPKLLREIRPAALARWEAALAREGTPPERPCRCGHTSIWHDFYHRREDGEWEVCWGDSGDCGFKERCDVCECVEFRQLPDDEG